MSNKKTSGCGCPGVFLIRVCMGKCDILRYLHHAAGAWSSFSKSFSHIGR